jgi:hypothetical protein
MTKDLKLEEQTIRRYANIDGKQVPIIDCPSKTIIKNKKTGIVYDSEALAKADIEDPNTDTVEQDIRRDVEITVANLELFGTNQ